MVCRDIVADALSTIYNNEVRRKPECVISGASKLCGAVLKVMQKEGYIGEIEFIDDGRGGKYRVQLLGRINKCGAIKPRFPVKVKEIDEWAKKFLPSREVGILVISTPKGVMTHTEAKKEHVGGVLVAYVY